LKEDGLLMSTNPRTFS